MSLLPLTSFTSLLTLFSLFSFLPLQAENPISLSLTELSKEGNRWLSASDHQDSSLFSSYQGKIVAVRGFLLRQGDQWFLFTQPVLRSCCTTKKEHLAKKLFVEGMFNEIIAGRAYTVIGRLVVQPIRDEQGELTALYHLESATLGET